MEVLYRVARETVVIDVDPWRGPFAEYDKYGTPIGSEFYRCHSCGREVLEGINREHVSH